MAGEVLNIKVCSPLKLRSGLTGNYSTFIHYSYNLPYASVKKPTESPFIAHQKYGTMLEVLFSHMRIEKQTDE
jgi:hypothetical protein